MGFRPSASKVPMMPASTSPVPAVASRVSPSLTTRTSPIGLATIVIAPFRRTYAPLASARRRHAANRSAPGRSPRRRSYSPSCGVNAVKVGRRRSWSSLPGSAKAESPSPSSTTGNETRSSHQGRRLLERSVCANHPRSVPDQRCCPVDSGDGHRRHTPLRASACRCSPLKSLWASLILNVQRGGRLWLRDSVAANL